MLMKEYIDEMNSLTVGEERLDRLLRTMEHFENELAKKAQMPGGKKPAVTQRSAEPKRGAKPHRGLTALAAIGLSVAACALFAVFALPALISTPGQGHTPSEAGPQTPAPPKDYEEPAPYATPEVCSQKLCGVAYQVNDQIYYACGTDGIFRINTDGAEIVKINSDYAFSLQVDGDWIYYECADEGLVKTRLDGSDRTILLPGVNIEWMAIDEGWIYCLVYDYGGFSISFNEGNDPEADDFFSLIKIPVDGAGETTPLAQEPASTPFLLDDWIYYLAKNGDIVKINKSSSQKTMVCENAGNKGSPAVDRYGITLDGEYIYYIEEAGYTGDTETDGFAKEIVSTTLCRIKTDGTGQSEIAEIDFQSDFVVEDGWVYYNMTNIDELGEIAAGGFEGDLGQYAKEYLYKIYCDGTQKQKLFETSGQLYAPVIAGDWVYIRISNAETDASGDTIYSYSDAYDINLHRVKKDGTGAEKVNLPGPQ